MSKGEILANSKFSANFDGLDGLVVRKISGISTTFETAGDSAAFGISTNAKTQMQATISAVTNGEITFEFVGTTGDTRLNTWMIESHSTGGQMSGGGSKTAGERKTGSIIVMNQAGEEAARWDLTGCMPKSYKSSKLEAGSTDLFIETVVIIYEYLHRVK
ncbi:MAG: phage tail protein [Cyanobacteria bacterium J06633_8]